MTENYQAQASQDNLNNIEPVSATTTNKAKSARFRPRPPQQQQQQQQQPATTKTEMLEQRKLASIRMVKQGPLHRTKLAENGKRTRKNWTLSHAVLTDVTLQCYKDAKALAAPEPRPDLSLDLRPPAAVRWCADDVSKRKHVFEVSSPRLTLLLQDDDIGVSGEWFQEVKEVIEALNPEAANVVPSNVGGRRAMRVGGSLRKPPADAALISRHQPDDVSTVSPDDPPSRLHPPIERKSSDTASIASSSASNTLQLPSKSGGKQQVKVSRTKSLKMKILGSNEDILDGPQVPQSAPILQGASSTSSNLNSLPGGAAGNNGNRGNIREKLRKFFLRRPTMDDLFRRGIIRNEPVFGSTLRELELADDSEVPRFVSRCVAEIEKGDFLKADGVYRQSGNLSHVQKIRLQVDAGNLSVLESVDDVHVLTGALKLFFRELREPLIPWDCVDRLLVASGSPSKKQKVRLIRESLATMPSSHRATLSLLLRHLLKVTEFKDHNRMQIPNLAIVFGPTLMWPPAEAAVSQNLALDMMQQNIIVEALLNNVHHIFV